MNSTNMPGTIVPSRIQIIAIGIRTRITVTQINALTMVNPSFFLGKSSHAMCSIGTSNSGGKRIPAGASVTCSPWNSSGNRRRYSAGSCAFNASFSLRCRLSCCFSALWSRFQLSSIEPTHHLTFPCSPANMEERHEILFQPKEKVLEFLSCRSFMRAGYALRIA